MSHVAGWPLVAMTSMFKRVQLHLSTRPSCCGWYGVVYLWILRLKQISHSRTDSNWWPWLVMSCSDGEKQGERSDTSLSCNSNSLLIGDSMCLSPTCKVVYCHHVALVPRRSFRERALVPNSGNLTNTRVTCV